MRAPKISFLKRKREKERKRNALEAAGATGGRSSSDVHLRSFEAFQLSSPRPAPSDPPRLIPVPDRSRNWHRLAISRKTDTDD